jgi:hypothetical protein
MAVGSCYCLGGTMRTAVQVNCEASAIQLT